MLAVHLQKSKMIYTAVWKCNLKRLTDPLFRSTGSFSVSFLKCSSIFPIFCILHFTEYFILSICHINNCIFFHKIAIITMAKGSNQPEILNESLKWIRKELNFPKLESLLWFHYKVSVVQETKQRHTLVARSCFIVLFIDLWGETRHTRSTCTDIHVVKQTNAQRMVTRPYFLQYILVHRQSQAYPLLCTQQLRPPSSSQLKQW